MRATRFFRLVWRINGILILAVCALVAVSLTASFAGNAFGRRAGPEAPLAVAPERGEELYLGEVQEVEGSPYVVLPLQAGERSSRLAAKFSSGSDSVETRNLLFHDVDRGTSRWLLPANTTRIRGHWLIRQDGSISRGRYGTEDERPVRWIRYEFGPEGQVGQGKALDRTTIAISGPAGDDLARVLEGVDEVLGYGPLRGSRQVVFFRRGAEHLVGDIDYSTRKVVQGAPLQKP